MANFDPAQRVETWLFQQIATDPLTNKPIYRRMKYNLVSYDGSPERVLEPVNAEPMVDILTSGHVLAPQSHFGRVGGMEYFTARPNEVFGLDDYETGTVLFTGA